MNFALIQLAPGNPISILSGQDNPSPEMERALIERYGLDDPVHIQFFNYLINLFQGDIGTSIISNQPVLSLIMERLGPTLILALTASILALILGTALGIYCARKRGSKIRLFQEGHTYSIPCRISGWECSYLSFHLGGGFRLLEVGIIQVSITTLICFDIGILPASTIVLVTAPYFFRISRSSVIQVMNDDFVQTLRATGMGEAKIFNKYVFKNAILPTITVFGITLAYIVTGVAIIEIVFSWPGMGSFMLEAISRRDYPLLMGIYLILSISVAVTMLVIDVIYGFIDPRIRYK
ncbi:LOW QUALITY PROTEIN: binding-protein-dependent transport systems inner membrane component [Geomicrobium sp. JCM 19055]|nr:LOW QUALITY PROTEIN: binding-protein-dependent transport systems inner membrane component [Geomicrobium sp. JCM 19055]